MGLLVGKMHNWCLLSLFQIMRDVIPRCWVCKEGKGMENAS